MTSADFWGLLLVMAGAVSAFQFARATWLAYQRPAGLKRSELALGLLLTAVCAYPAVLWGGQFLDWWIVAPEYGRSSFFLALVALAWVGVLANPKAP